MRAAAPPRVTARGMVGIWPPVKCRDCWTIYAGLICPSCGRCNVLMPRLVVINGRLYSHDMFLKTLSEAHATLQRGPSVTLTVDTRPLVNAVLRTLIPDACPSCGHRRIVNTTVHGADKVTWMCTLCSMTGSVEP